MRASVPTSVVDQSYEAYPEGNYQGAIAGAEIRDASKEKDGSWQTLKVAIESIQPREGTPNPGRAKFTGEITLKTNGVDLFEVEDFASQDIPFAIKRSAGLLAGLGEALGVAQREKGQVTVDLKQVAEALTAGDFNGEKIAFEVSHYKPKNKDQVYDQFNRFGPAA